MRVRAVVEVLPRGRLRLRLLVEPYQVSEINQGGCSCSTVSVSYLVAVLEEAQLALRHHAEGQVALRHGRRLHGNHLHGVRVTLLHTQRMR